LEEPLCVRLERVTGRERELCIVQSWVRGRVIDAKRKRETEKGSAEAERDTDSRVRANHGTCMLSMD
jgi:hypothetical protein